MTASRTGVALKVRSSEDIAPATRDLEEQPRLIEEVAVAALPAAAPDAPQRGADQMVRAVAHAVVLLSVLGFVVAYCVVIPLRRQISGRRDAATVKIVADPLLSVRAPGVAGLFRSDRPLPHGQHVRRGQLLGRIEAPALEEQIAAASAESRSLQVRLIRLEQRGVVREPTPQEAQEARELSARLEVAAQTLARLRKVRAELAVYAPADGVVQQGLGAAFEVAAHQSILSLYPDGGAVRFELSAPLDVVEQLTREGRVEAAFATPGGVTTVTAAPVATSARHSLRQFDGGREEVWATVQCVPDRLPPELRAPGTIGKLR
jgi:hypothetical protein